MPTTLSGIPHGLVAADLDAGSVLLELDDTLYTLDAVYGAAYTFIDRAWVLLDRPRQGCLRVTLAEKRGAADVASLTALAGEFANELLSCAWRQRIIDANRAAIEAVTMQALTGAMGPPSLDDLAKLDFETEPFEDPLGISVAWEDKYKKRGPAGSEGAK